jgi:tetratricopeptide (TPR) repeat protein
MLLIVPLLCAAAGGCAGKSKRSEVETEASDAMRRLDELLPKLTLPAAPPSTQPAPLQALSLYAEGRDALLTNRRQVAVEKLTAAIEADPHSSVAHRDLGYAWLGTDNDRALSAYKRAVELDPADVDVRVQVARLLALKNDIPGAIEQLRLARLSHEYAQFEVDAVAVDLLLGRLLSEKGFTRAAIECFEKAVPVLEARSMELRARPELADVIARPAILKLRLADLCARIGMFERSLSYYEQVRREEPSAAAGVELRIIQTMAKAGDIETAAEQMLGLVDRYDGSRASMQAYIDLFEGSSADAEALKYVRSSKAADKTTPARLTLEARLLRRLDRADEAATVLVEKLKTPTVASVRETVASQRQAGWSHDSAPWLLRMMNEHPDAMPAIARGWSVLINNAQPDPLDVRELASLPITPDYEAARQFAVARVAADRGQPVTARNALAKASSLDVVRVRRWATARLVEAPPDVDFSQQADMERFIEEFSDDPSYLGASLGYFMREGQNEHLLASLQAVVERDVRNLAALGSLVALLEAADRSPEAMRLVDLAAESVTAAPMLYQVSSLYTQLDAPEAAEQMLRRAHAADPSFAAACNDLGYLLADSNRELDFAEELLYRAVGLEPENPAYVDSLGWLLYKRGKFAEARKYLEQAIAFSEPADPIILDHAADAAYRTGDRDAARRFWDQAIGQIRERGTSEPQLRLQIERKLRQLRDNAPVDVAAANVP